MRKEGIDQVLGLVELSFNGGIKIQTTPEEKKWGKEEMKKKKNDSEDKETKRVKLKPLEQSEIMLKKRFKVFFLC